MTSISQQLPKEGCANEPPDWLAPVRNVWRLSRGRVSSGQMTDPWRFYDKYFCFRDSGVASQVLAFRNSVRMTVPAGIAVPRPALKDADRQEIALATGV
jgi:hypothetical protein